MIKTIRNLFICVFCFISVISTGFGMWYFIGNEEGNPSISGGAVNIEVDDTTDIGNIEFVSPVMDGYQNYGISISPDFQNPSDLYSGVTFLPNIKFNFLDYNFIESNKKIYYYFEFTSSSSLFANSDTDQNGFLIFDTTQPGHSLENKVELNIRDNENNFIYKTDNDGFPILDEEFNYIYEISKEFTPIFRYKNNCKPLNIDQYKTFLNALNNSLGNSFMNLHIISE